MPARATLIYLTEKYMDETRYRSYITDMLWAPANGKHFTDYKRFSELYAKPNSVQKENGEDILNDLINAW